MKFLLLFVFLQPLAFGGDIECMSAIKSFLQVEVGEGAHQGKNDHGEDCIVVIQGRNSKALNLAIANDATVDAYPDLLSDPNRRDEDFVAFSFSGYVGEYSKINYCKKEMKYFEADVKHRCNEVYCSWKYEKLSISKQSNSKLRFNIVSGGFLPIFRENLNCTVEI